jgi:hypothetical protein
MFCGAGIKLRVSCTANTLPLSNISSLEVGFFFVVFVALGFEFSLTLASSLNA